jgi:hypothetical protein
MTMSKFSYTIEALESEQKDSQPTPITLALQMSDDVEGGVDLVTLTEDGDVYLYVMTFNPDGTFFRHDSGNFADENGEGDDNPNGRIVEEENE